MSMEFPKTSDPTVVSHANATIALHSQFGLASEPTLYLPARFLHAPCMHLAQPCRKDAGGVLNAYRIVMREADSP